MSNLTPPTTEELVDVLRIYASEPDKPLDLLDVGHTLVPWVPEDSPEHEPMLEQVLRVLEVQTQAIRSGYLRESAPAAVRFIITPAGLRWLEVNEGTAAVASSVQERIP